jgi:OOP family OmpA-OmpF porin
MKYFLYLFFIFGIFANQCKAQEDAADCKDHFLFKRMSNTSISGCSQNIGVFEIKTGAEQLEKKEGLKTEIEYENNSGNGPSFEEIVKYYENAMTKAGGKKIYYANDANTATFNGKSAGKDFWIVLNDMSYNKAGNFEMIIIEIDKIKQEWGAAEMYEVLSKNGSFPLYINFDPGKYELKKPLQKAVNQIVLMLREHPFLKISIEGYTNNVGNEASNQKLSEERAKAVTNYLNLNGVGTRRVAYKGFGQVKPLFDNNTDEGKIKNNRLEIIKL